MDLAQEDVSEFTTLRTTDNSNVPTASSSSSSTPHDLGGAASGQDTDEIVREVKTRLFRSQVPWLLIFDNLEDRSLLDIFVPRGSGTR
jgi:hypothetical protein